MEISRSGIVAIVALCGAAGAGGAYLATRSNIDPATATLAAEPPATSQVAQVEGLAPVPARAPAIADDGNVAPTAAPRGASIAATKGRASVGASSKIEPAPPAAVVERPSSTADGIAASSATASREPEPVRAPEEPVLNTPEPDFEELVVARDVVLGLQMDTTVSSDNARVEDQVIAHVTRDVRVADRIAIPSGAKAYGEVTFVERGGRLRERARLGVRFSSLLLADGTRVPISTDVVFRDGDSASRESAAKIGGGAIGGAIIGGILGGGKGAILGGTAGAGAGSAAVLAGGRNAATLAAGAPVTVRLTRPVSVTVDR